MHLSERQRSKAATRYRAPNDSQAVFSIEIDAQEHGPVVLSGHSAQDCAAASAHKNRRLVRPFRSAWDWCWKFGVCEDETCDREMGEYQYPDPAPRIYVLPGNHDWYDSLSSFKTWFCNVTRPRRLGAWQKDQSRSYFALTRRSAAESTTESVWRYAQLSTLCAQ